MKTQHVGSLCPAFLPFTTDATLPSKKKQLEYLDAQTTASLCTSFYEPCMLETEVSSHVLDTAICARPNENLQTYKVAFVRIKEACKKLAIKILSLHARMQNTFWMAISCILVPGSKPENLKSRTKSHSLSLDSLRLTISLFAQMKSWFRLPWGPSPCIEGLSSCPSCMAIGIASRPKCFVLCNLSLPCREPLDLVSSGHFKISRQ